MRFTWSEELDMVRGAVSRFAKDSLRVSHDDSETFDAEVLRPLGLLDLVWEDDPKMCALVLYELAKADSVAALSALRSMNEVATGSAGLAFVSKERVLSFFSAATVAYSNGETRACANFSPAPVFGLKSAPSFLGDVGEPTSNSNGWMQTSLALILAGLSHDALRVGYEYANERIQFGKPIAHFQGSQFKLAEMSSRTDAASLLAFRAVDAPELAASAHAIALDSAIYVTDEALQLHGGYGYTREYRIERLYRDVRTLAPLMAG